MTAQPPVQLPRWFTVVLGACVILTVLLAAGFVITGIAAIANSNSIRANEIRQCQLANVTRQQDIAIWNRLLNVSPAARKAETPAQRAEVKDLERLVAVKDSPRDCNAAFSSRK